MLFRSMYRYIQNMHTNGQKEETMSDRTEVRIREVVIYIHEEVGIECVEENHGKMKWRNYITVQLKRKNIGDSVPA